MTKGEDSAAARDARRAAALRANLARRKARARALTAEVRKGEDDPRAALRDGVSTGESTTVSGDGPKEDT